MATLKSYDLNGKKLSFANWISELSPMETPFSSMTGKEKIQQIMFQWQTDHLTKPGPNWHAEGAPAISVKLAHTDTKSNHTQIMRKVIEVSDTANAVEAYGRQKEVLFQTEGAAKELRRDIEWALLNNEHATDETADRGRMTAGFSGLVAPFGVKDFETGAIVHDKVATKDTVKTSDIFKMTYQLYLAGSDANIIMFHPKWAGVFSAMQEASGADGSRQRVFRNTPKLSVYVSTVVDPLGQEFKLIPNRWMPADKIFFFNANDWTQMMLREPTRTKLAKDGSYEKWMIEAELGLRHRNPYASGILITGEAKFLSTAEATVFGIKIDTTETSLLTNPISEAAMTPNKPVAFTFNGNAASSFEVSVAAASGITKAVMFKDGVQAGQWTVADGTKKEMLVTSSPGAIHAGNYVFKFYKTDGSLAAISHAIYLHMKS